MFYLFLKRLRYFSEVFQNNIPKLKAQELFFAP